MVKGSSMGTNVSSVRLSRPSDKLLRTSHKHTYVTVPRASSINWYQLVYIWLGDFDEQLPGIYLAVKGTQAEASSIQSHTIVAH